MGYRLAIRTDGTFVRWFWSDFVDSRSIPENPRKGQYRFEDDWLSVTYRKSYKDGSSWTFVDRFKKDSINGVEVLLRDDAEEIYRRTGMIYTGGLLLKASDDPQLAGEVERPTTTRLFQDGVEPWSQEAETALLQQRAEPQR